jgi:hypothetical protein
MLAESPDRPQHISIKVLIHEPNNVSRPASRDEKTKTTADCIIIGTPYNETTTL